MFRLFSVAVFLIIGCTAFAQSDDLVRDLEQSLSWDRFSDRSRSRFGPVIFGDTFPRNPSSENFRFSGEFRLGIGNDVPKALEPQRNSPTAEQAPTSLPRTAPSTNTSVPVDVAGSQNVPIRRPIGFFQRSDVMDPNFVLEEPTMTPREQLWFREPGGQRETPRSGNPETGVGRGALGIGGEEMLRSTPNVQETTIRTPSPLPPNPEQVRRAFEERLEGMLLSDPNVHLLSPIRISFSGGTATVRGVVPNQTHKIAVGNILLSDPTVKQVNNLISVAPLDPNHNPPPIEGR